MTLHIPATNPGPHSAEHAVRTGVAPSDARGALVMVHGRGAIAESILGLLAELVSDDLHVVAPQADSNTWYPYSFLEDISSNEPYISSALATMDEVTERIIHAGIPAERICFLGFSQGACLASEYVARRPRRYGGLFALSGGLIGPPGTPRDYPGSLSGTPAFFGCSDQDIHIPKERVTESAETLESMGAEVTCRLYPGMGHRVDKDEIDFINQILQNVGRDHSV